MLPVAVTGHRLEPYEYPARNPEQVLLFDKEVYNSVNDVLVSNALDSYSFRHFTLYLKVTSFGTEDHIVCFHPQFGVTTRGEWFDYAQGLFAALCYEDVDTVAGLRQCFSGDCDGRFFRLRICPTAVDSTHYFTVSAWVEFWS